MTRLNKAAIGFNGLVDSLCTMLDEWHPPVLRTETDYSNALAEYLRQRLPEDARVEREYRHEGTTCDVAIRYQGIFAEDLVLFELKRSLRKKSDYDRLVGQVEGMRPKKHKVVVVLVGDTDAALLGRLRAQFKDYLEEGLGDTPFKIVTVA